VDIADKSSKPVDTFRDVSFDLVITVCGGAAESCPVWWGPGKVEHVGFLDPAEATGSEDEKLAVFRQVRDDIREQILEHLADY
jgi:arsenate reductase